MKYGVTAFLIGTFFVVSCTKTVGTNPSLAYNTKSLADSCKKPHVYYKGSSQLLPAKGPHGEHKLRLNKIARMFLDSSWSLAKGKRMPEGSMIIKDTYDGGTLTIYSFMFKHNGSWLWGETKTNGEAIHNVESPSGVCTGCHSGSGNQDFILSFN